MKLLKAAVVAAFLTAAPAAAQPAAPATPPTTPPRLIVAISVDQLSADLFAQYRQHFTGGMKRLTQGVVFPSGYQAHAATETCPGHSTILTGSRPSRTGIIANAWFNLGLEREDKEVYCSEDPRVPGSSSDKYTVSTYHLRVPALGDLMKRRTPAARVAVVAGKDRSAIMMGGYAPDQRFWWSGDRFVSGVERPIAAFGAANQAAAQSIATPRPALDLPPVCAARSRAVPVGDQGMTVGSGRFARAAGDARTFRASPELDGATLAFAAAARAEMKLGEGAATDLLIVGLAATDYIGHSFGTEGAETCLQMHSLDRDLGDFFGQLDAAGIDYLVVLTADHGGHDAIERHRDHAAPDAARVEAALSPSAVDEALRGKLGIDRQLLYGGGPFGDMYVARDLPAAERAKVLAEAVGTYRSHKQVAAVFTHAELVAAPNPSGPPNEWSLIERARASFDPERSGDFVVLLQPNVSPIAKPGGGYVATHGSPWDYDRRVPILFWRHGLRGFEQPLPVETVDILPTLAALIGLPIAPGSIDGRCLDLDEGPATSCR